MLVLDPFQRQDFSVWHTKLSAARPPARHGAAPLAIGFGCLFGYWPRASLAPAARVPGLFKGASGTMNLEQQFVSTGSVSNLVRGGGNGDKPLFAAAGFH